MAFLAPDIAVLLGPDRIRDFDLAEGTVYLVRSDLTLAGYNRAWVRFARENGGQAVLDRWILGSSILDAVSEPVLAAFYRRAFAAVRPGAPFDHDYQCSSAGTFRRFHLHVQTLGETPILLVTNTLVVREPHDPARGPAMPFDPARYVDSRGRILQCAECRNTARADEQGWEWVPELVEPPRPEVSHGLCPVCLAIYRLG